MEHIRYFDGSRVRRLRVENLYEARQRAPEASSRGRFAASTSFDAMRPQAAGDEIVSTLASQRSRLESRFSDLSESTTYVAPTGRGETSVVLTETMSIEKPSEADLDFLRRNYGMELVRDASHGKTLLRAPGDADDPTLHTAEAALAVHNERGAVAAPNFLRLVQRTPVPAATAPPWALDNTGAVGLVGADVHALAVWTVTRGVDDVRVAILDEGVDTGHPALKQVIAAEADFVDGNPTAAPDGDDAHGTACAGIVASQSDQAIGLADGVVLVAARIAKSNAHGMWIFDDFATADAIDWCWDDAKSDVLSNSWGGGPPSPAIDAAFDRARTLGRDEKGAVVVVAAGNRQSAVDWPGNVANHLTIGATNQWDKRKTRASDDGEDWWGSNFGRGLDLMAPGVGVHTTDISGGSGYSDDDITTSFNGTSSATPFVAATAAMMASVNPELTEDRVRAIIKETADALTAGGKWSKYTGHGRLNAYAAVRQARRG